MEQHNHGQDVLDGLKPHTRSLRERIPDVYAGFAQMHKASMAPGDLDTKTKELIALAIGISKQCDGCIASHARGLVRAGGTAQEAAEAIGVAILMNGGPATVYGPRAMAAVEEFLEKAERS